MSILAFVVFGFIVGLIARAVMPGRQSMGLLATALVGMGGSFIGGMAGSVMHGGRIVEFHTSGIVGSILGTLVVLFLTDLSSRWRVVG